MDEWGLDEKLRVEIIAALWAMNPLFAEDLGEARELASLERQWNLPHD